METSKPTLKVDVLVVGGGFMGLHVLGELNKKGYRSLLTTAEKIGQGQSLHMHGFLNAGAMLYKEEPSIKALTESVPHWRDLFKEFNFKTRSDVYLGVQESDASTATAQWSKYGVPFEPVQPNQLPAQWKGKLDKDTNTNYFKTTDSIFDFEELIEKMAKPLLPQIIRGEVINMKVGSGGTNVASVSVLLPDKSTQTINPKYIVLATGFGFVSTLNTLEAPPELKEKFTEEAKKFQFGRRPLMITIKGPTDILSPSSFSSVTLPGGLVNHVLPGNQSLVYYTPWILEPSPCQDILKGTEKASVNKEILSAGMKTLATAFPKIAERFAELKWLVYAGYRQQNPNGVQRHYVAEFSTLNNLCTAAPVQLGFVPISSKETISKIEASVSTPSGITEEFLNEVKSLQQNVQIGKAEFNDYEWKTWEEFRTENNLTL